MATADEILSQLATEEDKVLVINNDLRTITIPQTVKMLGVESDEDVLRLHFRMPKTYGETDLSEFVIRINYINAKGIGDIYTVSDTSIVDDTITFSWLISRNATAYKGSVRFIVCLKLYDETGLLIKEYNTTVSSLPVLEGLEVSDIIIEQNPDIIEKILLRLDKLENSGGVNVSGAQVGQTIRVSAVDESGKPTAWETSDFPEQMQSDYNQNDNTKSDYIKNRPFFAGDLVDAELADIAQIISDGGFEAQIVPMGENSFVIYNSDTITIPNITITIGDTYSFLIDGVKYTYVAVDYEGGIAFGDIAELSNQNYSELNFVVIGENRSSSFNTGIILFRGSTPPNEFKLIGQTQEIKKIDDKYLPDSVKNSEITINGKTIDKSNSLELIPSDIGASKIIYIEENNKRVAETLSEIKGYIDSGYDVRLIANSFGGIHMTRLDSYNHFINISLVGDLHRLVVYSAFISSAGTVNFIKWEEGNWYPDTHEREIELSKDIEGNWVCNYNLEDIKRILTYHPILIVGLSDLGIPSVSEGANVMASEISLLLTGNEQPVMDSPVKERRYVFSGTYGDYSITVTIGPTNSSNVTVTVENINSLPTVTEADDGKFLRVSGNAYVLEALTNVSEVGA